MVVSPEQPKAISLPSGDHDGCDASRSEASACGAAPSDELAAALIEHCRARMARFKCPRRVDFVDHLPRTDSGKLYKRRLRDEYRAKAEENAP